MAARSNDKGSPQITPRFRIVLRGQVALGHGKVELLEHLQRTGSIVDAAKAMDMSYMPAWLLIRVMNQSFREPVIATERGERKKGGGTLTQMGLAAIGRHLGITRDAIRVTTV